MFNLYFSEKVQEEHRFVALGVANAARMASCARHETQELPRWYWLRPGLFQCCARRRSQDFGIERQISVDDARAEMSARGEVERLRSSLRVKADYFEWWSVWVEQLYRHGRVFLTLGVAFNVFCAALLLGMYFESKYPDSPYVWRIYSGIVCIGLLAAGAGFLILEILGPEAAIRDLGPARSLLEPLVPRESDETHGGDHSTGSDSLRLPHRASAPGLGMALAAKTLRSGGSAVVKPQQFAGLPSWATENLLDT
eukprot:CAMPEP_0178461368 /NCGR_PEP_ID=MMETSP0689_2-20121128/49271_1 /TAXON_ID=160604 /ORGANISM="Amphidinium massartii, Strain CS-259" /LENGTH=253 /DNA_ID=CAMNT_0020088197 /DNA_START=299 /DNA_END=1056 /DNA_ORIENTATION=-